MRQLKDVVGAATARLQVITLLALGLGRRANHALGRLWGALTLMLLSAPAWAGATGMPWETPLTTIESSITGPVAEVFGVLAVVATGFGFATGEHGSSTRKLFGVVFGLSIAFAASSFFLTFFNFTGGVTF